jgi:hypothetical protein
MKNKKRTIICDKCNEKFEIVVLQKKVNELTSIFLRCPLCKTEYHSYYENDQSLSLQKDIDDLANLINTTRISLEKWQYKKMLKNLKNLKIRKKKILEGINKKKPIVRK